MCTPNFQTYKQNISASLFESVADILVSSGMKDVGYCSAHCTQSYIVKLILAFRFFNNVESYRRSYIIIVNNIVYEAPTCPRSPDSLNGSRFKTDRGNQ